jgi:N-acetylglucosamine kinase-like BadF-type ATPase
LTLVAGIDGGGSKTHCVLAEPSGAVVGFATNGPGNWETVGLRGAGDAIGDALEKALRLAGAGRLQVDGAVYGLAGLDWPSDVRRLESVIEPLGLGGARQIVNDSFIALRAGTERPWGVVVVAGTGMVAAGRNRAGETFRTLGLGRILGDAGSASDVSEDALRAVADAYVGRGPETALSDVFCQLTNSSSVAEMLEDFSRGGEPALSAAADVLRVAEEGDDVARSIVARAGAELGGSAAVVARRLEMGSEPFELVLAGGLFRSRSELLRQSILDCVPGAELRELRAAPVVGAALMALELAGHPVDDEVRDRLENEVIACFR